jgi:hypothetical protein
LADERAVAALRTLGADVRQVPSFVAKHPFRVTVPKELAATALSVYREMMARDEPDIQPPAETTSS